MMGKAEVLLKGPGDEVDFKPWPIVEVEAACVEWSEAMRSLCPMQQERASLRDDGRSRQ
jgi:hypothetical protein